jgi:hypothetical protein
MDTTLQTVAWWIARQATALEQGEANMAALCQQKIDAYIEETLEQMF